MRMLLACLSFVVFAPLATAQNLTAPPNLGGAAVVPPPPQRPVSSGSPEILRHRDPTGKPCLDVSARAQPHTINPNLYQRN
jgi:hypothetical protein